MAEDAKPVIITDDTESRRALDDAWAEAVEFVLRHEDAKPVIIERHLNCKHEHITVGDTCWCRPLIEDYGGVHVVIHNVPDAPPDPPDGA